MGISCYENKNKKKKYKPSSPHYSYNDPVDNSKLKQSIIENFNNNNMIEGKMTNNNSKIEEKEHDSRNKNTSQKKTESKKVTNINKENDNIEEKDPYLNLDINKVYYLVCPNCKCRIPHIDTINYDNNYNDFKILYKCICNSNLKESYLGPLFNNEKPSNFCLYHNNNILNYYCNNCKKSLCKLCIDCHIFHEIEDNNNFIPKEKISIILKITNDKNVHFKGSAIINKFIKRYLTPKEEKEQKIKEYCYLKELKGHKDRVSSIIKLQSGYIATGSLDGIIRIWIPENNFCFKEIQEIGAVQCLLEFEPNKILSGTQQNNISLRDILSENDDDFICNYLGHLLWVNCLIKCSDKYFASASNDCTIRIWDYYTQEEIKTIEAHKDCIFSLIKLTNGNLCSAGIDLSIKFWNWENGLCLKIIHYAHEDIILSLCEINNGTIISSSFDKTIKIWKDYKYSGILKGHNNEVKTLCKINDNFIASGSFDNKIKIWNIKTLSCYQTLEGHSSNVASIIKLNKVCLASCSCDKNIIIWKQK